MSIILNPPDFRAYHGLRVGAQYAKPVARQLFNVAPDDITPDERKALRVVVAVGDDVQSVFAERDRFSSARLQPIRISFMNYWAALHGVLDAKARLGDAFGDEGARARAVLAAYFADGVSFSRLDAHAAWFEGQRRLDRMSDEETADEVEALAGAAVFAAVKAGTAAIGEAIGVGKATRASDVPSATALQETLAKFSRAVGAYTRLLAAKVDEEDAASIERFRRAVAPIDDYRAMRGKESGAGAPSEPPVVEPTEPGEPATPADE
ncbi:hypothetical protein [Sandaracinus amylolyticus]|uniref:Uncharacterized protein n=1 Tax=Sandaracinus amylolyticus TaxID=927083 RepID=A0A0F6YK89_9BACT|nr:hypothetical protein [Sandaracinus amylolyticus]AKF06988.1 hypothetical protein DB32_004137 [Sandaracinus amylolyticus]